MKRIILALILVGFTIAIYGQAGNLDLSFNTQGFVLTGFDPVQNITNNNCRQVLSRPDGSFYLVLEMNSRIYVTHRLPGGSLDASYGVNGYSVSVQMLGGKGVMQSDGKIVIGGNNNGDFVLARLTPNGFLDNTFAGDGLLTIDFFSRDDFMYGGLALQADGKIVAAGVSYLNNSGDFALARVNENGTIDNSFSDDGRQLTDFGSARDEANAVTVQNTGRIVACGRGNSAGDLAIACYLPDGNLDKSFSYDGKFVSLGNTGTEIAIQSDGKIVVGGSSRAFSTTREFMLARFNADGTFDNSFSEDGVQFTDFGGEDAITALVIQSDGKIIAGGNDYPNDDFVLARYNADGSLDNSFADHGKVATDIGPGADILFSMSLQVNGKIIAAGYSSLKDGVSNYSAVRYNTDGTLDNSFDGDGKLMDYISSFATGFGSAAIQADGKIIAVGTSFSGIHYECVVVRYLPNGTLDTSFSDDGKLSFSFGTLDSYASDVAVQPDGKIVIVGTANNGDNSDFAVARLNTDGTPDSSFSGDGKLIKDFLGFNDDAIAVAVQSDGKIVVAGHIITGAIRCCSNFAVVRYNPDGTPDLSFGSGGQAGASFSPSDVVSDMVIQPDGKILVAGTYNGYNPYGFSDLEVARFNTDGSLDVSFNGSGHVLTDLDNNIYDEDFDKANAIALQMDGKIIVIGNSPVWSSSAPPSRSNVGIVRYNSDGSLDNSFSGDGKLLMDFPYSAGINSVAVQTDGKILAGGSQLMRLLPNGSPDSSFSSDGIVTTDFGYGGASIYNLSIWNHRLYATGSTPYQGEVGIVAAYQLSNCEFTVNIPDSRVLPQGVEPNTIYVGYQPATSTTLSATTTEGPGPYSILWSTGATTSSIVVSPEVPTTYSATVTNAYGCQKTATKLINVVNVRCSSQNDKVVVCHNGKELCVSNSAVAAHLQHGDKLGRCSTAPNDCDKFDDLFTSNGKFPFIFRAFPNPFSHVSTIIYQLPVDAQVTITLLDLNGREIQTLVKEKKTAGHYFAFVDRHNLTQGTYVCKMVVSSPPCQSVHTLKLMVAK